MYQKKKVKKNKQKEMNEATKQGNDFCVVI